MPTVKIVSPKEEKLITVKNGTLLMNVLKENNSAVEHLCGGIGLCKKCVVFVNGKQELSCKYVINEDIIVEETVKNNIESFSGVEETGKVGKNNCLCLDIGTTTLALALVSLDDFSVCKVVTATNPQRAFGGDVISRIDYSMKHGTENLFKSIIERINEMVDELLNKFNIQKVENMLVAGNTTMLHLFFNVDPSSMGASPYTPSFIESKQEKGEKLGLNRVENVKSLKNISAFVGADIVSGLGFVGMPEKDKYRFLIDLGTNAEIVLFSKNKMLCTAAAAGPCFEGANIECGMSATKGAISKYDKNGYKTIQDAEPTGICGTGLIDVVAYLIQQGIIDESGYMDDDFYLADNVYLSQKDVRQFQLAKSAVYSAVLALMKKENITFNDIDKIYISGGFSTFINVDNAIKTGLLPNEKEKISAINNSSLSGAINSVIKNDNYEKMIKNAEYVDLSQDKVFSELFIENMMFE